jgi:hypothetical protein
MKKLSVFLLLIFLLLLPACTEGAEETFPYIPEKVIEQDFYAYYSALANKLTPSDEMQCAYTLDAFEVISETLHLDKNNYRPVATFAMTRYDYFGNAFGKVEGEVLIHYYLQDGAWVLGATKFQPETDLFYLEEDTIAFLTSTVFTNEDGDVQARIISFSDDGYITVEFTSVGVGTGANTVDESGIESSELVEPQTAVTQNRVVITAPFHKFISVDTPYDQTHYFQFRNETVSIWLGNCSTGVEYWSIELDSEGVLTNFIEE